ncbi:MAG: hypothetical protein JXA71_00120 [Chitinispirillaceae bacterium]|nr:hypothetical protein [Chitinispirillaceae bacterium]
MKNTVRLFILLFFPVIAAAAQSIVVDIPSLCMNRSFHATVIRKHTVNYIFPFIFSAGNFSS